SHVRLDIAGAEGFYSLEGNMCGTAMRGAVVLPGSKATSRTKGSHRNLGGLVSDRRCGVMSAEYDGPHRGGEERTPMVDGQERSDAARVASKPGNKAEDSVTERSVAEPDAAEPVERRAGTKGNASQQSTRRTQCRVSVSQALERIRKVAKESE